MKANSFIPMRSLQLFADGGTAPGTGVSGEAAAPQTKGDKGNPLANVIYGKQEESAPAAEVQTKTEPPDRKAEFERMIKGEYKEFFDEHVRGIISGRLKSVNATVEKYNSLSPVLDILSKRYGVDANDISAMTKAIEDDAGYLEEEALKRNMTVEQLKQFRKIERENEAFRRKDAERQDQERQQRMNQMYVGWMNEAQDLKKVYPSFNLETELKNEQFQSLLRSGVNVRTAFEVIHKDEIIPAAMQYTAAAVEQKISKSIASGRNRPAENGNASQGAATHKTDPSQFTRADREEIRRRVQRGERIVF